MTTAPRHDRVAYAWLIAMAVAFGGTWVAAPWATDEIGPLTVAFVRFVLASVLLFIWARVQRIPLHLRRSDLPLILAMGATAVLGYNILFLYGVRLAPSTDGSIIVPGLAPVVTTVLVWLLYGERLAGRATVGLGLAVAGLVLVIGPVFGGSEQRILGDLLFVGGAIVWGIYSVVSRLATTRFHPVAASLFTTVAGIVMLAPFTIAEGDWAELPTASPRALGGIAYLGAIGTVLALVAFSEGIRRIGTARASAFTVLVPVVGVVLSAWLLGDPVTPLTVGGGALVLAGLWLVQTAPHVAATDRGVQFGRPPLGSKSASTER
jgi:drug/metabolite transporter (DMT)-like permease